MTVKDRRNFPYVIFHFSFVIAGKDTREADGGGVSAEGNLW
jgi:hypothetical protein